MKLKIRKDLSIRGRLLLGFGIITIILAFIGLFSIYSLGDINNSTTVIAENSLPSVMYSSEMNTAVSDFRIYELGHVLSEEKSELAQYEEKMNSKNIEINNYFDLYSGLISNDTDRALLESIKSKWNEYLKINEEIVSLSNNLMTDEAVALSKGNSRVIYDEVSDMLFELAEFNQQNADLENQNADKLYSFTSTILIIVVIISIIISIVLSLAITKGIVNPINNLVEVSDELAIGNVNVNVSTNSNDEIGRLMKAFERMIENIRSQALTAQSIAEGDLTINVEARSDKDILGIKLAEMVANNNAILSNISVASEEVAAGASQISESSIMLSQGATEQASSIEELTASLEEISAQTSLSAKNANKANEFAEKAKFTAENGNQQMKEMLNAMNEINSSSTNISKIIKVIDDIAFQTNILALNAAVEAARAGQHGKGFAVVAEEVRNLAARSASAAKETTEMIENSIKKSQVGTNIAQNTAKALNEIVEEVDKVANLVNDIATSSNEQAAGLEQINIGVMQVSQVVQANSATSEEGAAASEELTSQAQMLKEMVGKYKLKK
ncbi:MAG: methyl-accepting chemotaxis protein [Sedimentibacter saalensis]|uniref:methyl-accepting chemotaxis protein n=1 Tax=Sedimentibacter saalensis TaxID=130788 RepID=UPI002B21A008|nr:methyl-accepting chemotaxis protein [Sedimentibacter saalensis]MEA5093619.1 methyl-accepting chemotaxis protein [Sedimentibacter saalensis]